MPVGSWIYERGSATGSGGGGGVPPDAPPVTIGTVEVEEIFDGRFEVRVPWTKNASATAANFTGVAVFLEDPDMSETPTTPMDDTVPLDDTHQMAGKWLPVQITKTSESPATIRLAGQAKVRKVRVYLQAYNKVVSMDIVRANLASPTPNVQATIPAKAASYQSGIEYTWLVIDCHPPSCTDAESPTVKVIEDFDNPNGARYQLKYGFRAPDETVPLPPGLTAFGGIQIFFEFPDEPDPNKVWRSERFLSATHPDNVTDNAKTWNSEFYEAKSAEFNVYFCSVDVDGRANLHVRGVTPMVPVTIVYPPDGQPIVPPVTDFTLTNPRHEWQPDGTQWAMITATWVNPDVVRFAVVEFWRVDITPPRRLLDTSVSPIDIRVIDWPTSLQHWVIAAISVGRNNKLADNPYSITSSPTAIWDIGPPGSGSQGHEYTPQVTIGAASVSTAQQQNSDGVVMMSHTIKGWVNSTDNSFGGVSIARVVKDQDPSVATNNVQWWDAAKNLTTITTDWEPAPAAVSYDFYFVARDQQGKRNTIVMGYPGVGTTPKVTVDFVPVPGNVLASRLPKDWFNEAEFEWPPGPAGKFTVEQIVAPKIYVGSILRVGGGPTVVGSDGAFDGLKNGQIAVYNSTNVLQAWMGQQDGITTSGDLPGQTPVTHSVFGGWFRELYVGGDGPPTAPVYANKSGIVAVGGFDVAGGKYPYISIRDNTNAEVGRIGAKIGFGPLGNQSGPEQTIQGAWFREFAYGGQSFTDWRMLAKMDPSSPLGSTVEMRNINKFQIDYAANYNPGGVYPNNFNAENILLFGYDAFVADGPGTYKFPGLSITRKGTWHQAVLINRGIVLNMPSGTGPYTPVKAGSFVTYNGDQTGADGGQFWCELSLYSQTSGKGNVSLGSGNNVLAGAAAGASHFRLYDGSNTPVLNFGVDETGNVIIRGALTLSSAIAATQYYITPTTQVITTGGQFDGPGGVNTTGAISSTSTVAGSAIWASGQEVINSSHQFVGSGGVSTAGAVVATGAVTGFSFSVPGGQVITNGGQFNGSGGVNTTGEMRASGSVSAGTGGSNGYWYNGQQFVDNAGPSGAMRIVRQDGYVLVRQYFAYDSGLGFLGGVDNAALVISTPTGNKTLRINGGIITGIT